MKKFKTSPITIACYIIAALLCVYFVVLAAQTVKQINEYYASYGMTAMFGETVTYILQQGLTPLVSALLMCMAGVIHNEVRKLNPANWTVGAETAEAGETNVAADNADFSAETEDNGVEFVGEAKEDDSVEFPADEEAEEAAEAEVKAEETAEAAEEAAEAAEETADAAEEIVGEASEDIEHTIVMDAQEVADALKASYDSANKAE